MASVEDGTEEEEEIKIQDEEAEQDAEPLRVAKDPKLPSQQDVEDHRCSHIPFREWCRHCVLGRGRGDPHLRTAGSTIPIVGLDYFFIEHEKIKTRKELDYAEDEAGEAELEAARASGALIKCLVVRCAATKNVFGHVIPCKGADEEDFAANRVVKIVEWLGHTELILKEDNEPALQSLTTRILELIRVRVETCRKVSTETPPAYDSQSNGGVEVGVMLIRGMFRTLRLCLEARIDRRIPVDHALIPWLLEHTCMLINVKTRGADGLTGWARARGRNSAQKLIGFGEKILYKLPMKGPHAAANMDAKWADGAFVGYSWTSNTYAIETREGGITTARSLKRVPMANRWCPETLSKITATPWARRDRAAPEVRFTDPAPVPDVPVSVAPPAPTRRFRINDADVRSHGFTDGCTQCSHIQRYGKTKPGAQHTEKCRERILDEIGKSDEGKARLTAHGARADRYLAEHLEHTDQHRNTTIPGGEGTAPPRDPPRESLPSQASPTPAPAHFQGEELSVDEVHRRWIASRNNSVAMPSQASSATIESNTPAMMHPHPRDSEIVGPENDESMDVDDNDAMGFIGSLEPSAEDYASEILLQQLGSFGRSYRREARASCTRIVSEMYSSATRHSGAP